MPEQARFPKAAWVPLLSGLSWLWIAPGHGIFFTLLAALPGCLLLVSGGALLLVPGDRRITHYAAFGGLLGAVIALPALFAIGFWAGFLLMGLSAWSFTAVGAHSLLAEPPSDGVPAPIPAIRLSAEVAADEAMLASVLPFLPAPRRGEVARINAEMSAARELFEEKGWLEKPAGYHSVPIPLDSPTLRAAHIYGIDYEQLIFESGFEPHSDEPGRDRWLSYQANRTARAWVLRHRDANRPWLVCIHGYQMGTAGVDLLAFPPDWLHHGLGLNLVLPVLPLHGARKIGRRSGDGFLAGDILDSAHAEAQAIWDIRRILGWVRAESESKIGVFGLSLGGYNAALLSTLDDDLACAIAGVPLVDMPSAMIQHGLLSAMGDRESENLDPERMGEIMSVVSPLALEPLLPVERRFLFAAVADRLVPPEQAVRLWEHWDRPRIEWYQGAHMTFRAHSSVRLLVEEGLRSGALAL
ncbi:MAG: prolyl oligopeptidase family serine peptidase [Myxococcales bacterium]|nr:prolyl oligopeptidase family serine peptidase [Myxococcales bacterium]